MKITSCYLKYHHLPARTNQIYLKALNLPIESWCKQTKQESTKIADSTNWYIRIYEKSENLQSNNKGQSE